MVVALAMICIDKTVESGVRFGLEAAEVIKMSTKQHVFESKQSHSQ